MGDSPNRDPPACIRNDILIYQNRCLTRMVRSLKRELVSDLQGGSTSRGRSASLHTDAQDIVCEDLKLELIRAYAKLDRVTVALLMHKNEGELQLKTTAPVSPQDDKDRQLSSDDLRELELLRKELIALRSADSLAHVRNSSNVPETDLSSSTRLLLDEIQFWKNRCISAENEVNVIRVGVHERWETVSQNVNITSKTYLMEVERMAEELARIQQETHKLNAVITLLNATKADVPTSVPGIISEHTTSNDTPVVVLHQQLQHLTSELKACNEKLRVKEEIASRILAQHVQLQQIVTSLEQENVILRNESDTFNVVISEIADRLDGRFGELVRNVGLLGKVEEECTSVSLTNSRLQEDFNNLYLDAMKLRGLNEQSRVAFAHLQEQFLVPMDSRKTLSKNTPLQNSGYESLLQRELEEMRAKVKCSLCQSRDKSVTLTACMHCFCRVCVDEKMLNARNRKCPLCMQRFSDAEVRDVHFLNA